MRNVHRRSRILVKGGILWNRKKRVPVIKAIAPDPHVTVTQAQGPKVAAAPPSNVAPVPPKPVKKGRIKR